MTNCAFLLLFWQDENDNIRIVYVLDGNRTFFVLNLVYCSFYLECIELQYESSFRRKNKKGQVIKKRRS